MFRMLKRGPFYVVLLLPLVGIGHCLIASSDCLPHDGFCNPLATAILYEANRNCELIERAFPDQASRDGWFDMNGNLFLLHMNEQSGTINDSSGGGLAGTYNGIDYRQAGKHGDAIGLDGADDYIDFGTPAALQDLSEGSLLVWFFLNAGIDNSLATYIDIFERNNAGANAKDFYLDFSPTTPGTLELNIRNDSNVSHLINSSSDTWVSGIWYHAAATWSATSGEVHLYINGALQPGSVSGYTGVTLLPAAPIAVGSNSGGTTEFFPGRLDEMALWNRALSAQEIATIYDRQVESAFGCE